MKRYINKRSIHFKFEANNSSNMYKFEIIKITQSRLGSQKIIYQNSIIRFCKGIIFKKNIWKSILAM